MFTAGRGGRWEWGSTARLLLGNNRQQACILAAHLNNVFLLRCTDIDYGGRIRRWCRDRGRLADNHRVRLLALLVAMCSKHSAWCRSPVRIICSVCMQRSAPLLGIECANGKDGVRNWLPMQVCTFSSYHCPRSPGGAAKGGHRANARAHAQIFSYLLHMLLVAVCRSYIANRVTDKLTRITDNVYCCRSGSAADTQAVADIVSYYMDLHRSSFSACASALRLAPCTCVQRTCGLHRCPCE